MQLQKEKKELQVYDEDKLKDMGILFGMSEHEVEAIAIKQKEELQRQQDSEILFGQSNYDDQHIGNSHSYNTSNVKHSQSQQKSSNEKVQQQQQQQSPQSQILMSQSQSQNMVNTYKESEKVDE